MSVAKTVKVGRSPYITPSSICRLHQFSLSECQIVLRDLTAVNMNYTAAGLNRIVDKLQMYLPFYFHGAIKFISLFASE